jgi:aminoglycoside 6'-N-acetyltransferase I
MCLRIDYVEGSSSSPVGYIEVIFVEASHRNKGISKRLVKEGEGWSKSLGCRELASDTELHNKESQEFHKRIGFEEAGRIVFFIKEIE